MPDDLNLIIPQKRGIVTPCAIKGCSSYAMLDRVLGSDEFVLCSSCENAIFLTVLQKMTAAKKFPPETPRQMALVLNAWRREAKGLQMPTRPSSVGN